MEELESKKRECLATVKKIDDLISRHPETIVSQFSSCFSDFEFTKDIIADLEFVREVSGWTDSRKNPCSYHGFDFKFKDEDIVYTYRYGDNWCSEVRDVISSKTSWGSHEDLDWKVMQEGTDEDGEVTDGTISLLKDLDRSDVVGHMFYYTEGW